MTTPRPKRWFLWVDDGRGSYAESFTALKDAEAYQAMLEAKGVETWILETLDEEQERRLAAHPVLLAVLEAARAANDMLTLSMPAFEVKWPRHVNKHVAQILRPAIAAAETALGRKP